MIPLIFTIYMTGFLLAGGVGFMAFAEDIIEWTEAFALIAIWPIVFLVVTVIGFVKLARRLKKCS